jgi:hypothetical protein
MSEVSKQENKKTETKKVEEEFWVKWDDNTEFLDHNIPCKGHLIRTKRLPDSAYRYVGENKNKK